MFCHDTQMFLYPFDIFSMHQGISSRAGCENCVDFMPNIICQGSFFGTSEFYKKRVFRLRCSIYGGYERNNIIMKFPYHKLRYLVSMDHKVAEFIHILACKQFIASMTTTSAQILGSISPKQTLRNDTVFKSLSF